MKLLAILGSTGSIGQQTLEVVRAFPDRLRVVGLAAGQNGELLAKQISQFQPQLVSLSDPGKLPPGTHRQVSPEEMVTDPQVDLVVIATSGMAGLAPTLAAIGSGKSIALANKEVLVTAGEIVAAKAKRSGVAVLPVDSEHSALWQCLWGEQGSEVAKLVLTASGGPFRQRPLASLSKVTAAEALQHPTWRMGKKVTIDSATLFNKGLEVIEARWLFNVTYERIEVLLHPQSIIHSMVEFCDGSVKAQLSQPDMRLPIQYALSYPERWQNMQMPKIDWRKLGPLTFEPPDMGHFPCLRLAIEAGKRAGTCPAALSAADEVAVELFLAGRIGFLGIARLLERVLEEHPSVPQPSLNEILAADRWARKRALEIGDEQAKRRISQR
jgi:1-deoxy-D-xylulose-5-phosphate reductoisomerase